jgi:hypothetical protein
MLRRRPAAEGVAERDVVGAEQRRGGAPAPAAEGPDGEGADAEDGEVDDCSGGGEVNGGSGGGRTRRRDAMCDLDAVLQRGRKRRGEGG